MSEQACIALMRGINVGGKHRIRMAELRAMFEASGSNDVSTYIQSGNVVFSAEDPEGVCARVEQEIQKQKGFDAPIVLRRAEELASIVESNPFENADGIYVMFLRDEPDRASVDRLDPDRSPPDRFETRGREIFLQCPNGVGRTKLTTDYFDSILGTISTRRNWRTVLKLLEMSREIRR